MTRSSNWRLAMPSMRQAFWLIAWFLTVVGALFAGIYVHKYRATIRSLVQSVQPSEVIQTNLYILRMQKVAVPTEGRDGGIAALGDGLLLVNRNGKSWFVDHAKKLRSLNLGVPVNVSEFESDPYNVNTVSRDRFGVKDILVQSGPNGVRVLVSHTHWFPETDCYALRVSSIETSYDQIVSGASGSENDWRSVFETAPCRTLNQLKGGKRAVTLGAGGRLAALSENEILLSVGGFGAESEGVEKESAAAASKDDSYGKIVLFDLVTGQSRIYTRGNRNPQGLAVGSDSRVWATEHGPKGADELNRVLDGRDYGWPHVTYGTEYEMMTWPGNPHQGRHDGYEKPMFAWIPSIGVSQLIVVEQNAFPFWKGDLIVSSLKSTSLFRVRIEDDRTIFAEPISIGHRIRDIAETRDGSIVLKTDDDFLAYLEPSSTDTAKGSDASSMRGQLLATQCQGCHTFVEGGSAGIGPNLWGIVGRRVASVDEFNYSEALEAARLKMTKGRWTTEALNDFLSYPESFAPGNTMQMTTSYNESQVSDLIEYLETLE